MKLIKRYWFWLLVSGSDDTWYNYWLNTDLGGYLRFRYYARNHELYDDSSSMVLQDRTTLFQILSDYFYEHIENDFDAKFQIWLHSK